MMELKGLSNPRLAEIWCELNRWEWPAEVPNPEKRTDNSNPRRFELMAFIVRKVGRRACMEEWNKDR
jgi:hypothetical protein